MAVSNAARCIAFFLVQPLFLALAAPQLGKLEVEPSAEIAFIRGVATVSFGKDQSGLCENKGLLFFVPIREIVDSIFERMLVEVGKAELEESILTFGFFLVLDEGVCCTRLFCCDGECIVPSLEYGVRIGAPLTERLIVAGEFDGFSNIFSKDSKYEVFNSFMAGPSVIFYPAKHLQLSGSLGFAWTDNRTNSGAVDVDNGKGLGYSLSAAFVRFVHK